MNLIRPLILCMALVSPLAMAESPSYKIQLDPSMALAGYANVQVDRAISETLSLGLMLWHFDEESWSNYDAEESSMGVRIDWFEDGVFDRGWHSNAMVKVDLENAQYARTRLKLTQSYQLVRGGVYVNLGIGVQFVSESDLVQNDLYEYQSWMLPAWEFSVGRAF